jgi:hypothetical protein
MKEFWAKFNPKISEKDYTILGLWWAALWRLWVLMLGISLVFEFVKKFFYGA